VKLDWNATFIECIYIAERSEARPIERSPAGESEDRSFDQPLLKVVQL